MTGKAASSVQRQVCRVRRRLFVQALLRCLAWCWAVALAATAAWLLVQPFLTGEVHHALRWGVPGGLVAAACLLALALALRQAPGHIATALMVDERLGLKERVTTALTLTPSEAQSPAAQALLADVHQRLDALDINPHFPVRVSWLAALVPAGAAVFVLIALSYEPHPGSARGDTTRESAEARAAAKDLEEKLQDMRKASVKPLPKDQDDARALKGIEDAWNRLLDRQQNLGDKEKVREQVQAMRTLEEKLKDRAQNLKGQTEKNQALVQQLQKLKTLDPKGKDPDMAAGPVKDVQEALSKGKLNEAQEALEALHKKLTDGKLSKQELKQLQEQLQGLGRKLQRLAEQKDRRDQLARDHDLGNLDEEQLKQALEQLEQEGQDLEELARMLEECKECLKKGQQGKAAGKLKMLARKLKEIQLTEEELRDLEENGRRLEALRAQMLARLNGQEGGGSPGTKRPMGTEEPTQVHDARQQAETDPKGRLRVTGFSRGGTFSKIQAKDVAAAFRQAEQDAPAAIERQRIAPEDADMLKGYYENLGGQQKR
jgi:hypothetical protein